MVKSSFPVRKLYNEAVLVRTLLRLYNKPVDVERLRLLYAVEKMRSHAEKNSCEVTEIISKDGSIKLLIDKKET